MDAPKTPEDVDLVLQQSLAAINETDEPLINGLTPDDHEEFMRRRTRSPDEQVEHIQSLMQRCGTARLPGRAANVAHVAEHQVISQIGYELRQKQLEREQKASSLLAEIGPWGVMELISEHGLGGVIERYDLSPIVFARWCERVLGKEQVEEAEHLLAERMLYQLKSIVDKAPVDKVEADHINHRSKTYLEMIGLWNRKRARAAPKIDIQQVQQKAVEVTIQVGTGSLAADVGIADRQKRVAQARMKYGTGLYVDPPGLEEWEYGQLHIPEERVEDYLMLRWVPEEITPAPQVIEGEATAVSDDPTEGMDEPVPTFNPSASGLEVPEDLFD